MHLLVSNDDGYQAPGLKCLTEHLGALADISVIAPSRDRSGASNSLTLDRPLHVHQVAENFYYVDEGTPTDCVHLGITGFLDREPDMVVSGINCGANLGDAVLYSGTVAAAMEGRTLGHPAVAVSMTSPAPKHYETGAQIACRLVRQLTQHMLDPEIILNVNVPDCPLEKLRGIKVTRLGDRHRACAAIRLEGENGEEAWQVGPPGAHRDSGEGTDFYAVRTGYVSVTPLQIDLTRHHSLAFMREWLQQVSL